MIKLHDGTWINPAQVKAIYRDADILRKVKVSFEASAETTLMCNTSDEAYALRDRIARLCSDQLDQESVEMI
jgi:hypothetical protein